MKIFISWSGEFSHGAAVALQNGLPTLFNGINCFVSSESVRKGERWLQEVSKELDESNLGIACLTPDNLDAPWLHFETGAISKSVKKATVYTLLLGGLRPADIHGPLSQFQHTSFAKDDVFKLIKAINEGYEDAKQDETRLRKIFDGFWWDELEKTIAKLSPKGTKTEKKRDLEEMVYQLIETTSQIARNIPIRQAPDKEIIALTRQMGALEAERAELDQENKRIRNELARKTAEIRRLNPPMRDKPDPSMIESPLSDLLEHNETLSTLHKAGIYTVGQLASKRPAELLTLGIHPESIETLELDLKRWGIEVPPDIPAFPHYEPPSQRNISGA